MKYAITARTVTLSIEDATAVTVTTSSLNKRIIVPVRAEVSVGSDGRRTVVLNGPQVRESGQLTATWFKGKVSVDSDDRGYVSAPDWVRTLVAEVLR